MAHSTRVANLDLEDLHPFCAGKTTIEDGSKPMLPTFRGWTSRTATIFWCSWGSLSHTQIGTAWLNIFDPHFGMETIQKRLSHRELSRLRKLYGPKLDKISKLTNLSWSQNGASYALSPKEFPTCRSFVQAYLALQLLRLARAASGSPCGQVQLGTNKMTQMHGCFMWGLCLQNWWRNMISHMTTKTHYTFDMCCIPMMKEYLSLSFAINRKLLKSRPLGNIAPEMVWSQSDHSTINQITIKLSRILLKHTYISISSIFKSCSYTIFANSSIPNLTLW